MRLREEWRALVPGVFAVGAAALFATFSRSAILGLGAGLASALLLLLLRRDWPGLRYWLVACVLAGVIDRAAGENVLAVPRKRASTRQRRPVGSTEERSLSERAALARNTNEIFVDHPLAGVGVGVLPTAMWEAYPDFRYNYAPAHIVILVVAAETGMFGAVAYGTLMLAPWLLLWLRRAHLTPELIGVSGALLALQVIGLFDYYTWSLDAGRIWFWLVIGAVGRRLPQRRRQDRRCLTFSSSRCCCFTSASSRPSSFTAPTSSTSPSLRCVIGARRRPQRARRVAARSPCSCRSTTRCTWLDG